MTEFCIYLFLFQIAIFNLFPMYYEGKIHRAHIKKEFVLTAFLLFSDSDNWHLRSYYINLNCKR